MLAKADESHDTWRVGKVGLKVYRDWCMWQGQSIHCLLSQEETWFCSISGKVMLKREHIFVLSEVLWTIGINSGQSSKGPLNPSFIRPWYQASIRSCSQWNPRSRQMGSDPAQVNEEPCESLCYSWHGRLEALKSLWPASMSEQLRCALGKRLYVNLHCCSHCMQQVGSLTLCLCPGFMWGEAAVMHNQKGPRNVGLYCKPNGKSLGHQLLPFPVLNPLLELAPAKDPSNRRGTSVDLSAGHTKKMVWSSILWAVGAGGAGGGISPLLTFYLSLAFNKKPSSNPMRLRERVCVLGGFFWHYVFSVNVYDENCVLKQ